MPARYDPADVKSKARGRWAEILASVAGIPADCLDGDHHPCPRCGGADRFRFTDRDRDGSLICNACARRQCGDGIGAVQWALGLENNFPEALARVAEYVGAPEAATGSHHGNGKPAAGPSTSSSRQTKPGTDPGKDLQALPWSETLATLWAARKPPIRPAAILAAGGRLARYRRQFTVVDLPVIGADGSAVGHAVYNATGGTLPKYDKQGKLIGQVKKAKTTWGTAPGLIGRLPISGQTGPIWKVEGPSDVLAFLSCQDLPADVAVVTNASGAGQHPDAWILELAAGRQVLVIGDADKPGDEGAATWAAEFARHAAEVRQVRLPFPVTDTHGQDLRDWLAAGHGYADLLQLASQAAIVQPSDVPAAASGVLEADDDPHRLARVNLQRYAELTGGRTIKCWRSEWYTWKGNRYVKIQEDEFRAKVSFAIKEEFDRLNLDAQERFRRGQEAGVIKADEEPPKARKVLPGLVTSVLQATASLVSVSGEIEIGTWLPTRERKNLLSFKNGLLDIDKLLVDADQAECFFPNTPDWFSTISIPYDFDPTAKCPMFEAVQEFNLDLDPEKLKVLQEWAGYVLTPDTGEQKFLILEGEGSNGKSVYVAAVTAMLGEDNVSTVPLEVFGERFARAETLGKLLNAAADCGELDKVAEGYLKPFTSGDRMFFDRKGVPGLNCRPTARLMVAVNQRPRFSDRSRGIWRRMKLIKFDVEITREKRIKGLDKIEYWQRSGELPGILNWALRGLARLRAQGDFTECESENQEIEDYKEEVNPARSFLNQYVEESDSGAIPSALIYSIYKTWCGENGYHPLAERSFGKEVKRKFPKINRRKMGNRQHRFWEYYGIQFSQEEISGKSTSEMLFS